jgi:MoaA/NifB/PqqE/SkfB family radical SAM enzyme
MLSTNGLGLDLRWLKRLRESSKTILTISIDGEPEDHRRMRRALPGVHDAYDHILSLLPELHQTPRVVVTQTIAPATAGRAVDNFRHLRHLGFHRFNLLPGYFIPWKEAQLERLETSFEAIGEHFEQAWARGERLYLRNLFTYAPTPFFNTGVVIDSDGSIHPSNIGLSGKLDGVRSETCVGTLDSPPSIEALETGAKAISELLEKSLSPTIIESTRAVDRLLSQLCRRLYPSWASQRARRQRPTLR